MKKWMYWALGAILGVIAALYIGGWYLTGRTMPPETTIAGVDVSSLSPSDAQTALEKGIEKRKEAPILASHDGKTLEFLPADYGFEVDVKQSVANAGGERSWSPRAMWAMFAGGGDHPPTFTVDTAALRRRIAELSTDLDVPVLEPRITFPKGEPKVREPRVGDVVDQTALTQRLKDSYLMREKAVAIPINRIRPEGTSADAQQALTQIAKPAISGPVALTIDKTTIDLPVSAWTPALSIDFVNGEMAAVINSKKLAAPLLKATVAEKGTTAPVDASYSFVNGKPQIIPSKQGQGVDPAKLAVDLVPVLQKQGTERALTTQSTVIDPIFTTADAQKLGIKEKVSSFVTYYPPAEYRDINQGEAARRMNGSIIKPGETFSFNETVGERTKANGFVEGMIIDGGLFSKDLGGGVSQVVTTAFNAAFFAGLEDIEHHPHSLYMSRYPVGREATVAYGVKDLRFKNPFDTGIVIHSWVNKSGPGRKGEMHVEMWGTKVYDITAGKSARRNIRTPETRVVKSDKCVPQDPVPGFDIDIYRTFLKNGKVVRKETTTTHYKATDRIICG